jgi:hypothetical protein
MFPLKIYCESDDEELFFFASINEMEVGYQEHLVMKKGKNIILEKLELGRGYVDWQKKKGMEMESFYDETFVKISNVKLMVVSNNRNKVLFHCSFAGKLRLIE